MSATEQHCNVCRATATEADLKACAQCQKMRYCSKHCQREDWKQHKQHCHRSNANDSNLNASDNTQPASSSHHQRYAIDDPFGRTAAKDMTFLHDRPEAVVYELLIDAYRMFAEDEHAWSVEVRPVAGEHNWYTNGEAGARRGLRSFFSQAEARQPTVLPPWWSPDKSAACFRHATEKISQHHRLDKPVDVNILENYYGNWEMYRHLRILANDITGQPYGGISGFLSLGRAEMKGRMMEGWEDLSKKDVFMARIMKAIEESKKPSTGQDS